MGTRKAELKWKCLNTKDYDWNTYRTEWITSKITYDKLCEKYKLDPQLVRKRASRELWGERRKEFSDQLTTEVGEEVIQQSIARLIEWNNTTIEEANYLREAGRRMYMIQENGKWKHRTNVPYSALGAAASAIQTADKIARLALGASTENNRNLNKSLPTSIEEFI